MKQKLYIAGPMRGYPRFNFDAFYAAESKLQELGWDTLNPARMDEELGFDPDKDIPDAAFLRGAMKRDIEAVSGADGIVLLPGWESSCGANAEMWLARWLGIPVYLFPAMKTLGGEDVLEEALRITSSERQKSYGTPDENFANTAAMWKILLGVDVTPRQVALCMVAIKLCREVNQPKRDNLVDIAGYARCASLCRT